jgi:alpha-tubulin suppressor-like RCC1 family protein
MLALRPIFFVVVMLVFAGRADASTVATGISATSGHTCSSMADGTVDCWGKSYLPRTMSNAPVQFPGISGAVGVQASIRYNCVLLAKGTVKCWGDDGFGQLGDGSTEDSPVPVQVSGISGAIAISTGGVHACALLSTHRIECWGRNVGGALGNGTVVDSHVPVQVHGITNAIGVTAGFLQDETCAVLATGRVDCWGPNRDGQLGNGTHNRSTVPVGVRGITNAIQAAASGSHVCAVLASGRVDCWGRNDVGQLGNGTRTSSAVPVRVSGITNAAAVAVAVRGYSCAVLRNGSVECWGHNDKGQLGIGHPSSGSLVPVRVTGLTGAVSISTGAGHACSLLSSGGADCWGYNDYHQLGFGAGGPLIRGATPVAFAPPTQRRPPKHHP